MPWFGYGSACPTKGPAAPVEGFVEHSMGQSAQRVLLEVYGRWPFACSRMHALLGEPCAVCNHLAPDRGHHYWECPVAQAGVQELHRVLAK